MRITLVLLVRDELTGLRSLFDRLPREAVDEVIAVDGGSTDGTREFLEERGVPVLAQERPGRGEAMRVAAGRATGDALLFFSPDGNEDPEDIPRFRTFLDEGCDLVIASRMVTGACNEEDSKWLRWRKWANRAFTVLADKAFRQSGPPLTDAINGFRALSLRAFRALSLDAEGYAIEYQMTIRALQHGMRIAEFPTQEGPRLGGESGAASLPTGWLLLRTFWKELHRTCNGRVEDPP